MVAESPSQDSAPRRSPDGQRPPGRVADLAFRSVDAARGVLGVGHPGPHRVLHDARGVAGVLAGGPALLHVDDVGRARTALRRARVHLRNAGRLGDRARVRGAGEHRDRAVHHRDRAAAAAALDRVPSSTCSPRCRRSSTGCGASLVLATVRLRASTPTSPTPSGTCPVLNTLFSGRPLSGVSFMTAGLVVGAHDHADHHVDHP